MKPKLLLLTAAAAISTPAMAAQINYAFTGTFLAYSSGYEFTLPITLSAVGDTEYMSENFGLYYMPLSSVSVMFGSDPTIHTVIEQSYFFRGRSGTAGLAFGDFNNQNLFSGHNESLLSYNGKTNIGPIAIGFPDNFDAAFTTDYYSIAMVSGTDGTFSARLTAPAVPEPATWALMLVGFGGIGYAMRRNRKVAVSFG